MNGVAMCQFVQWAGRIRLPNSLENIEHSSCRAVTGTMDLAGQTFRIMLSQSFQQLFERKQLTLLVEMSIRSNIALREVRRYGHPIYPKLDKPCINVLATEAFSSIDETISPEQNSRAHGQCEGRFACQVALRHLALEEHKDRGYYRTPLAAK